MTAGGRVSLRGDGSEAGCGVVWPVELLPR